METEAETWPSWGFMEPDASPRPLSLATRFPVTRQQDLPQPSHNGSQTHHSSTMATAGPMCGEQVEPGQHRTNCLLSIVSLQKCAQFQRADSGAQNNVQAGKCLSCDNGVASLACKSLRRLRVLKSSQNTEAEKTISW